MSFRVILPCVLFFAFAACVENDEELTIRPDGSVAVRLHAKGRPKDLAEGYALPLLAPWRASDATTLEWLRVMGPDTGSPQTRANLDGLAQRSTLIHPDEDVDLEVAAEFASVRDLPRHFAPASEPYRTAYLERSAELRVEEKGGRRVYTLERVLHRREFARFDLLATMDLDSELQRKLENEGTLTDEERAQIVDSGTEAMRRIGDAFARDALGSIYSLGDASVPAQACARAAASARRAVEAVVPRARVEAILRGAVPPDGAPKDEHVDLKAEALERDVRATLRTVLEQSLAAEGVPQATRNAVRAQLEWLFTAYDATTDMADESFTIGVRMPGTVVDGNYGESKDGMVGWKIDGKMLQDRDVVLRVVSVLE